MFILAPIQIWQKDASADFGNSGLYFSARFARRAGEDTRPYVSRVDAIYVRRIPASNRTLLRINQQTPMPTLGLAAYRSAEQGA